MIKNRKQMFIVVGAFLLVLLLGTVTYAFFNYTRTGSSNVIKVGRIAFNSTQGNSINLTNMFPIDVSSGIPNDATKDAKNREILSSVFDTTTNYDGSTIYGITGTDYEAKINSEGYVEVSILNGIENISCDSKGRMRHYLMG